MENQFKQLAVDEWWLNEKGIKKVEKFLRELSNPDVLFHVLNGIRSSYLKTSLCEKLLSLDKLVLFQHKNKTRVRLHSFKSLDKDLVHNHKWPFVSVILKGELRQEIYTSSTDVSPVMVSNHQAGDTYYLSEKLYHSLSYKEGTVTLILRGQDLLSSAEWNDITSNESWTHTGGDADPRMTKMNATEIQELVDNLKKQLL
ncbi:hypothetical protein ACPFUZ_003330 [Vibrio cholerae]